MNTKEPIATAKNTKKLGAKVPHKTAVLIQQNAPPPPDTQFRQQVNDALSQEKVATNHKRRIAGILVLQWLTRRGRLLQSEDGTLFYFFAKERRLFKIESTEFAAWLYGLCGANPAGADYSFIFTDVKSAAVRQSKQPVLKFSCWDNKDKVLYVSRFDGTVYRLDGDEIEEVPNGEHVLFLDDPGWKPYNPVFEQSSYLDDLCYNTPSWESYKELYGLILKVWILSLFFPELCPTKVLLVLRGEKGSGKSMTLRMLLRLFFGPAVEVSGVPDKQDGFAAAAYASYVLVLDNFDDCAPWLRDKISRIVTGSVDAFRKLYTTNEVVRFHYRCWLACTSRDPETLRRDDLADRLLILPVKRINKESRKAERHFLEQVVKNRDVFWGTILNLANKVVKAIRQGHLSDDAQLRIADWESLGRVIAIACGKSDEWEKAIPKLSSAQTDLLLENDLICEALDKWLGDRKNFGRKLTGRELHDELRDALKYPDDWFKTPTAFMKKLSQIRTDLSNRYGLNWEMGTTRETHNRQVYWFEKPKGGV